MRIYSNRYIITLLILFFGFHTSFSQNGLNNTEPQPRFYSPEIGFTSWLPAYAWQDALLLGNGTYGAMVYGNPHDETIILNHASLFLPSLPPTVKTINQFSRLDEIRKLMLEGKFVEATRVPIEIAKEEGYNDLLWIDQYQPAFDIRLKQAAGNIRRYKRSLNYQSGEAKVEWEQNGNYYCRSMFTSRSDTVIVMKISGTGKINCSIRFARRPVEWNEWGFINEYFRRTDISAEETLLKYRCEYKKNWEGSLKGFDGLGKLYLKGGSSRVEGSEVIITDADEVTLFIKIEPFYNYEDHYFDAILKDFEKLESKDYKILLNDHVKVHGDLFNRVTLDLNGAPEDFGLDAEVMVHQAKDRFSRAFVQRQFYAARYNILCSTGINPPTLQGIWNGFWSPPWRSAFTHDGNLPTAVSSNMCSNMPELIMPFIDYHINNVPYYKENAQRLYGCRGINVPGHTSDNGYNVHFSEIWCLTFWTGGAGWAASFFYDYFLYTGDLNYLKEKGYPFMKEAALFYEDFLAIGDNGKYIFNPSYSPENNPKNSESQATLNATMDVMIAKQTLRNCIEAGKLVGEDKAQLDKWADMLTKMPEYEVNENGELREWLWPGLEDNHAHRHVSQLYGLYDLIDPDLAANPALIEGAKKAIDKRMEVRRRESGGEMVFGMAQMAYVAANLGEREMVSDIIKWLSAQYWSNSLATYHNPGNLFNMDLSGGFQAVIIKALVYSDKGFVSLLPGMPKDWDKGSIKGILLRSQIKMKELSWNRENIAIVLNSEIDQKLLLKSPSNIKKILIENGKGKVVASKTNRDEASLLLIAGEDCRIIIELKNWIEN